VSDDSYLRRYIPACETYGWNGGPGFSTRIVMKQNGRERRNADWSQPQFGFSLPFQNLRHQSEYAPILQLFLNRRGAWGCFLYSNPLSDTAEDELFAVAAAGQTEFQLRMDATLDGVVFQRDVHALYEPDPDEPGAALESDIEITADGVASPGWAIDYDRGKVLAPAPMTGGEELRWSGRFSHWVRFVSDRMPMSINNRSAEGFRVDGSIDLLEMPPPIEITT